MGRGEAIEISVIIVNYQVATMVLEATASVARQRFAGRDGGDGRLEILVVDNASSPADLARLDRLHPSVVQIRNSHNLGFAQANNQAIRQAKGRYLCFLNPDTLMLDGALDAMLQYCDCHPGTGAVGPRTWADRGRTLLLPPGDPPTLAFLLGQMVAPLLPIGGGSPSRRWHSRTLTVWRSHLPVEVPMLSGGCLVTPKAVIDQVGGFDPGYFLYYEDTDWCRRVRQAGYRLVYVPDAEIVHYFNQSAQRNPREALGHALRSQARFVEVHYGLLGRWLYSALRAMRERLDRRRTPSVPAGILDLGSLCSPPGWRLPEISPPGERLIEIGFNPSFVPSAAAFVQGAEHRLSSEVWERLQPGRYYARLLDPERVSPLMVWSWVKE